MERIEIDKNEALSPGDIVELHYKTIGLAWITAAQVSMLESKLQNQSNYQLLSTQVDNNRIIIKVKIVEPQGVTIQHAAISPMLIIKAVAVIGAGVLIWLSLDKIYKITESPAGKVLVGGLGSMALAAGIAGLLAVLGLGKKG